MVDAARDAGVKLTRPGLKARGGRASPGAGIVEGRQRRKRLVRRFGSWLRLCFEGYRQLTSTDCEVLAIVKDGVGVPAASAGDEVEVVLDHTSFYGDSGGQMGDTGVFLRRMGIRRSPKFRAACCRCRVCGRIRLC